MYSRSIHYTVTTVASYMCECKGDFTVKIPCNNCLAEMQQTLFHPQKLGYILKGHHMVHVCTLLIALLCFQSLGIDPDCNEIIN